MSDNNLLPVLIIPGIASSGLQIKKSALGEDYVGQRAWMNAALLAVGSVDQFTVLEKEEIFSYCGARKNKDGPFSEREESFEVRSAWVHHMSLCTDMVSERPGNELRPYEGLEGCEYLSGDQLTKVASWCQAPVVNYLVDQLGYERGKNVDAAPYDWRLPPKATEDRDGYLTSVKERVEKLYADNDERPVILFCHSMGCKMGHYFLNFALEHFGQEWLDQYIHTYMPVGAPHCGVANAVRAGLIGAGLAGAVDMMMQGEDEGLVLHRSWGSGAWLMPRILPSHVIPSVILRREGEFVVALSGPIELSKLDDRDQPVELRLGVKFRDEVAYSSYEVANGDNTAIEFPQTFYFAAPELEDKGSIVGKLSFFLEEPAGKVCSLSSDDDKERGEGGGGFFGNLIQKAADGFVKFSKDVAKMVGSGDIIGESTLSSARDLRASEFMDDDEVAKEHSLLHPTKNVITAKVPFYLKYEAPRLPTNENTIPIAGIADECVEAAPVQPGENDTACAPASLSTVNYDYMSGHQIFEREGFTNIHEFAEQYFENDPIGPKTKSATDSPPVKRVRAIYGINVTTEVSAVYRHRPAFVIGDDRADSRFVIDGDARLNEEKLDRWDWKNFEFANGIISETKESKQETVNDDGEPVTIQCSGDGTVPYWNLAQAKVWKPDLEELTIDELDGAPHREILADKRLHELLKKYCVIPEEEEGAE